MSDTNELPTVRVSGKVVKEQVIPLLLQACPSFEARWQRYVSDDIYEPGLLYIELGQFAHHLVELLRANETAEFESTFQVIDKLHTDGDSYVQEAITVGLLEGVQNVAGNTGVDPEEFRDFLGPDSETWWNELNAFWNGEPSRIGRGRPKSSLDDRHIEAAHKLLDAVERRIEIERDKIWEKRRRERPQH